MAATAIPIDTLPSINPATGEVLAHFERTPVSLLPEIVSRARVAQVRGRSSRSRDRCEKLRGLCVCIMASRNELAGAVVRESGKPRVEALFADISWPSIRQNIGQERRERSSHTACPASQHRRGKPNTAILVYDPSASRHHLFRVDSAARHSNHASLSRAK